MPAPIDTYAAKRTASSPAYTATAVTPSDSTELSITSGLHINGAGNISLLFAGSTTPVTLAVLAGVTYPFAVVKVMATGTTASGITALYS